MEKEFIPYEVALELKQIGFNEPCFFAFDNCSYPMRCSDLRTNEQKFNGVNYNSSPYTSQPTYSQAFRFFREKHGLLVDFINSAHLNFGKYIAITIKNGELETKYEGVFKNHEEAELACLKKLIEIVKNGGNK